QRMDHSAWQVSLAKVGCTLQGLAPVVTPGYWTGVSSSRLPSTADRHCLSTSGNLRGFVIRLGLLARRRYSYWARRSEGTAEAKECSGAISAGSRYLRSV